MAKQLLRAVLHDVLEDVSLVRLLLFLQLLLVVLLHPKHLIPTLFAEHIHLPPMLVFNVLVVIQMALHVLDSLVLGCLSVLENFGYRVLPVPYDGGQLRSTPGQLVGIAFLYILRSLSHVVVGRL
jgi:hypothetical protein